MYRTGSLGNLVSLGPPAPVIHASHDENCRVSAIFNTCTVRERREDGGRREPKYDDALHLRFCLAIINGNP